MARQVREGEVLAASLARTFGRRIRARRNELYLSQGVMAERVRKLLGRAQWAQTTLSELERGNAEPALSEVVAICLVLGSTPAELLDFTVNPEAVNLGGPVALDMSSITRSFRNNVRVQVDEDGTWESTATEQGERLEGAR